MRPRFHNSPRNPFWDELPDSFVNRLREGDGDAWKDAFPELRKLLTRNVASEEALREATNGGVDLDDLFSISCRTFFSKLTSDDDFLRDGASAIPGEFARICRNSFLDFLRRFSRERKLREPGDSAQADAVKEIRDEGAVEPFHKLVAQELEDRLHEAVERLTDEPGGPECRALVHRHYLLGESRTEIAKRTGYSDSKVWRVLQKALDRLRAFLSDDDHEDDSAVERSSAREPRAEGDELECSAYAPAAVMPGAKFMLQVFAHLRNRRAEATRLARTFDDRAESRGSSGLQQRVLRGETLTFDLFLMGGKSDEVRLSLVWSGRTESVTFLVTTDLNNPGSELFGRITVSLKSIPIGRIVFKVRTDGRVCGEPAVVGTADRFHSYFVSYSRKDARRVMSCVQVLQALGKEAMLDRTIKPGELWEEKLREFIRNSDVTLLFWSSNAKASTEVRKECRYCVEAKGVGHIIPVILEKPPPEPFPELASIQMDDRLIYFLE